MHTLAFVERHLARKVHCEPPVQDYNLAHSNRQFNAIDKALLTERLAQTRPFVLT